MVEPFYNSQARVERFDGGLEIINETGMTVRELRPARTSEFAQLSSDLVGYWKTEAICAAVELGVMDALPGILEELSARCGVASRRMNRLLHPGRVALGHQGRPGVACQRRRMFPCEKPPAKFSGRSRRIRPAFPCSLAAIAAGPAQQRHMAYP